MAITTTQGGGSELRDAAASRRARAAAGGARRRRARRSLFRFFGDHDDEEGQLLCLPRRFRGDGAGPARRPRRQAQGLGVRAFEGAARRGLGGRRVRPRDARPMRRAFANLCFRSSSRSSRSSLPLLVAAHRRDALRRGRPPLGPPRRPRWSSRRGSSATPARGSRRRGGALGPGIFARAALAAAASACLAAGGAKHWSGANAEAVVDVVVDGGREGPARSAAAAARRRRRRSRAASGDDGRGGGPPPLQGRPSPSASPRQRPAATLTRLYIKPSAIVLHLERAARLGDPATGEVTRDGAGLALLGRRSPRPRAGWVSLCPALDAAPAFASSSSSNSPSTSSHSPYLLRQEAKSTGTETRRSARPCARC